MMLINCQIYRYVVICILIIAFTPSYAQNRKEIKVDAELMKNLTRDGQQVVRYLGNVIIRHQGTKMTCDSAHLNRKQNIVEAYNHVVITKDEATLYGDFLYYDGNTSMGKVEGREVKLVQKDATLTTDKLFFNTKTNSAYYNSKGVLKDSKNKLESKRGYYYSQEKKYYFAGNVEMNGEDGRLYTDSLEYGADTEIAKFYGPTRIYNNENFVYCQKGWYDRKNEQSNFSSDAILINKDQKLFGQDIFYDKRNGFSRIVGEVAIYDSTRNVTVYGGKANYWDDRGEAVVTENPLLVLSSSDDTLFLRANILSVQTIKDNSLPDSSYKVMKALGDVKFYKKDVQGLCDTLIYNTKDSTISLINNPVLWNEKNQITANLIRAYSAAGNKIRKMDFEGNPLMCSREEGIWFNQIKGKNMVAYFSDGKLSKLDVTGNGQTVYFLRDKGEIVTVNKVESSDLTASIKNNTLSRIVFKSKPVSTLFPIQKVELEEVVLKGFRWLAEFRPGSKQDIIPEKINVNLVNQKQEFLKKILK